jgi:hypothetical protein
MTQTKTNQSLVVLLILRHTGGSRYPSLPSSRKKISPKPRRTWIPASAGMTNDSRIAPLEEIAQALQPFVTS